MLLEYGLRNFLSFKEGASVSFELDAIVTSRVSPKLPAATVVCVMGANGSGKTNLLKGLAFVADFVARSFSSDPDAEIPVASFFSDPEPSSFYVDFKADDTIFHYELDVTASSVIREALFDASNRMALVFERSKDEVRAVAGLKVLEGVKLRRNASVISAAYHHQCDELLPVHAFFSNLHFDVGGYGARESPFTDIHRIAQLLSEQDDVRACVERMLKECDLGISRLKIASEHGRDGGRRFYPVFIHEVDGRECQVMPVTASAGTMQIFHLMVPIAAAVTAGSVLVLDELGQHLHSHLLPKLLGPFLQERAAGESPAQLLFSAHQRDATDLCGPCRTTLVNKDNNQSYADALDEVPAT